MGVRAGGFREEPFRLTTLLDFLAVDMLMISGVLLVVTLYSILAHNVIGIARFSRAMIAVLVFSIIHLIFYLFFLLLVTPPIIDWTLTTMGLGMILSIALLHLEIFGYFSSLTSFWTKKKVLLLQLCMVVLFGFCQIENFVQLYYLGSPIAPEFPRILILYGHGMNAFAGTVSVYHTLQSFYIVSLLYSHFKIHKAETFHLRIPRIRFFIIMTILGAGIDWVGIFCFAVGFFTSQTRTWITLGITIIYLHISGIALLFVQLKKITLEQEVQAPESPLVRLVDLPKITASYSVATVQYPNQEKTVRNSDTH
jgi:hypothetical protein